MRTFNIHEAKTHLSRLIEAASRGEGFIIARAGKPLVRVLPIDAAETDRKMQLGFLQGAFSVPDDFNDFAADEIAAMFGKDHDESAV